MSILAFPYWGKVFHVHVDASSITFGTVLMQPRERKIDNMMYSVRKFLSKAK
jgi:hypothetical protein